MPLHNDTHVIHVIRKLVAAMMALSLLLISTVPMVSAASICKMPDMTMSGMEMQMEPASPLIDLQDCFIECGCRVDNHLDGMPHQLAPHALSMTGSHQAPAMNPAISLAEPAMISLLLPLPVPPPRSI